MIIVFIHIGKGIMINIKDIVMILDYQKAIDSPIIQKFLQGSFDHGIINKTSSENQKIKSLILTSKKLFYSPFTVIILTKRIME